MSMADFDLRKLEYFLAVAEGMNISRAAKKLGMTQPALSRQIRAFEESLGWELLERGKKSIKLTRAGEIVVKEGERILKSVELGVKRMRQEIEGAEMRVGYAPSLASGLIEKVIACFSEKYPRVSGVLGSGERVFCRPEHRCQDRGRVRWHFQLENGRGSGTGNGLCGGEAGGNDDGEVEARAESNLYRDGVAEESPAQRMGAGLCR
jgi:DNA-binding transcriptional LysR family regulator